MRALLIIPLTLLAPVALGWIACRILGSTVPGSELLWAVVTCGIASALATLPLLLTRHASQTAVVQAGLVATMVHLFVAVALGAVVYKLLQLRQPFLFWLLGLYWATLIGVATVSVQAIKRAAVAMPGPKP